MKRFAAHYILYGQTPSRLHYVEVTDDGLVVGVFPLTGEVERTEFHDGCIAVLPASCMQQDNSDASVAVFSMFTPAVQDVSEILAAWSQLAGAVSVAPGEPVRLCLIRLPHPAFTALLGGV